MYSVIDAHRVKEQLAEYVHGRIQELAEYSECTKVWCGAPLWLPAS